MYPFEYLLAVALLTAPADTPDAVSAPEMYTSVRPVVQAVAVQWEILDPREVKYILTRQEDFFADLNMLRRRYQELVDAPALCDCLRFPERAAISDMLAFNRSYR